MRRRRYGPCRACVAWPVPLSPLIGAHNGCALRVVCLLKESHVGFQPGPILSLFHATAYPTAPFSSRHPSVQSTSPGWESALAPPCLLLRGRRWRCWRRVPLARQEYLVHPSGASVVPWLYRPGTDLAWFPRVTTLASARGVGFLFSRLSAGRKPDSAITTARLGPEIPRYRPER